jgi:SAM-dependent methyltransferase
VSTAAERWRDQLEGWAIPQPLIDAAPESPYGFPAELFRQRALRSAEAEASFTTERALDVLPAGGTVLDVGAGGGATSLPLAARAGHLTGVDQQADMLAGFEAAARGAGVAVDTVRGGWPDVGDGVAKADVVMCGHVAYNVPELAPFARALNDHANRRVVMEMTDRHPMSWMNDLWLTFHGLVRPTGPSYLDATAVVEELGFEPEHEAVEHAGDPAVSGFARRDAAVALVRRRLCLSPDRDAEIAEALGERLAERGGLWAAGPPHRVVATIWWDVDRSTVGS